MSNFFPILISAGAAGAYDSMRAHNATYIQVGSTSDADLRQAFKEVTGKRCLDTVLWPCSCLSPVQHVSSQVLQDASCGLHHLSEQD